MRPAYDLTDPYDVARWVQDHGRDGGEARHAGYRPHGSEHIWASRLASLAQFTPGRAERLTADEALAALTLARALRAWTTDIEPALIEAAREAGATWDALAPYLGVADRRAAQRRYARLVTPNAPDWAAGDDFTAVAELLAAHGYARQPDAGDGVVRWVSTRTDLPTVRVWIGPYRPSPGSAHGGESVIQMNDEGKDFAIGELSSETARDIFATCLAEREREGFYDPLYCLDDDDV